MNIMRKLMGTSSGGSSAGSGSGSASGQRSVSGLYDGSGGSGCAQPADNSLGLMHLRKLYSELKSSTAGSSQRDLENMLYNMLPLFCKVFGSCPGSEMLDKFPDVLQFCGHVSRLMVSEIRRRASNQSTDAASCAIVKFLEIESTEELSNGWMLLCTINLLSMGADSLIDSMTVASLPSTLVKCLYLFFDLPDIYQPDTLQPGCEFTPRESRVLLQKVFVQVLVRLCSRPSPAEELARKDDLTLLFSAITSWCPAHNVPWRKSAAEVLMTLSRHGLTPNVVQYIHNKGCIAVCIENMQRVQELSPIELVEMFVTVFCFLKDSSEVSQVLLDDFRAANGYIFLTEFLLKMEKTDSEESLQALRNLVLLVGSLSTCGFVELKPNAKADCLYQMPGFTVPQPSGTGQSIRNLQAFQVLQTVFLKGTSCQLCSTVLDVISSLYHQDSANYFILEPQNTMSQFAEKIYMKPADLQIKFLEIIEFLVFGLNFIPCKELITISIIVKTSHSVECSVLCMRTLLKLLHHHIIYKDVFREVGLIEVMVTCLQRYAALLKESNDSHAEDEISAVEQTLGSLAMEAVTLLLTANSSNAGVFRECGGARCVLGMVQYRVCRSQSLGIVQQLILSNGGEEDFAALLGLMHTSSPDSILLKMDIIKMVLSVLRESHRSRMIFRKVGGFVYVMSVLVSMEGALADPPVSQWHAVCCGDVIELVRLLFTTLTTAMRFEPANARFFVTEVRYASLTEAVRLLGCFDTITDIQPTSAVLADLKPPADDSMFSQLFHELAVDSGLLSVTAAAVSAGIPQCLVSTMCIYRCLYDMALDVSDRQIHSCANDTSGSPRLHERQRRPASGEVPCDGVNSSVSDSQQLTDMTSDLPAAGDHKPAVVLPLNHTSAEPLIVHAGAVVSMLHLLPSIACQQQPQMAGELQLYVCGLLKSLVRSERNQQIMCEACLPHELLSHATVTLESETHFLHRLMQYVFERLAAQSLTPKDLRDFLRLGAPLFCAAESEEQQQDAKRLADMLTGRTFAGTIDKLHPVSSSSSLLSNADTSPSPVDVVTGNSLKTTSTDTVVSSVSKPSASLTPVNGGPVLLTRVKCLVSMTTPRDVRLHGAAITPSFVEFDMSCEGFGCMYLPSIAPQGPITPSVVSAGMIGGTDQNVVTGIGTGERAFPPASGLTYCTWFCVDKFSCAQTDPHPIRLLTICRHLQHRDDNLVCFMIFLSAKDRTLLISTQEQPLLTSAQVAVSSDSGDLTVVGDNTVRFLCQELSHEGQWHHLAAVVHKASITKNSSISLFIDGIYIATQKLHFISPYVNSGTASPASGPMSVFAYIGTPPALRRQSRLLWRQGPCYLIEEVVAMPVIQTLYRLGPNYVGSLQAQDEILDGSTSLNVAEERLVFGIHAHAMSLMTLAKIRKIYNKIDAKLIAKQLSMSDHENATPIRILHNSSGHLNGPARCLGAILIGYLSVRTFSPKPVAKVIMNVGGTSSLLGLVAMASDIESLYASVKALVCVVRSNKLAAKEMDRIKGYQMLAMLFKKKRHLLNSHILHLTFSLVGTLDSGRETSSIPHKAAFENLLCDLEIWHGAPFDLHKSLYEHLHELLAESHERRSNLRLMQELGLVSRLLHVLNDTSISMPTLRAVAALLSILLSSPVHSHSLVRVCQFLVSLLPTSPALSEKSVTVGADTSFDVLRASPVNISGSSEQFDVSGSPVVFRIRLRNVLLNVILRLTTNSPLAANSSHSGAAINAQFCEDLQRVVGFDWLLVFLQSHVHQSTVVLAMSVLVRMLQQQTLLQCFRDGSSPSGWLADTECVVQNRVGVLLGFNIGSASTSVVAGGTQSSPAAAAAVTSTSSASTVGAGPAAVNTKPALSSSRRDVNQDICNVPGFTVLQWLLSQHPHIPHVYFMMMALLVGQPVQQLPTDLQLDLDSVWKYVFGVSTSAGQALTQLSGKLDVCIEAAGVLLANVRSLLNMKCELAWINDYPVTVMQFLLYLYHNHSTDFVPLCMSSEFLSALAATLFPYKLVSETNSEIMSPVEDFRPFPNAGEMVMVEFCEKPTAASPDASSHPVRKFVMDFIRRIVIDSLSVTSPNKSTSVIDVILEMSPENSTRSDRHNYQTELLNNLMDHVLAADVLLGDQAALSTSSSGSVTYTHLANNVFYLAGRIVDKLWQGTYTRDPNEVFDFLTSLISQAKRKASGLTLDSVYKSLNRTVLYLLSRPVRSVTDQMALLDALHRLTSHRSLILGPGNFDQEFIGCLCYCLIQLTANCPDNISSPPGLRKTTWHVMDTSPSSSSVAVAGETYDQRDIVTQSQTVLDNAEAQQLLTVAANRVWEELYVCKKPTVEDIFKVTLSSVMTDTSSGKNAAMPDLIAVRAVVQDSAAKLWETYYENERKCVYSQTERIQSQLQSKLQKVGQGVMRLAARKSRKDIVTKQVYVSQQEWQQSTLTHVSIVRDLVDLQLNQYQQSKLHMSQYTMEDWLQMERELTRQRGLWGPPVGSDLDKWMLDMTEGPYRMRKKLVRNFLFYQHYPYKPSSADLSTRSKVPLCADSKLYYERYRPYSLIDGELVSMTEADDSCVVDQQTSDVDQLPDDMALGTPSLLQNLPRQKSNQEQDEDGSQDVAELSSLGVDDAGAGGSGLAAGPETSTVDGGDISQGDAASSSHQVILRLLEDGETITHMFRCARIQGLDTVEGLLVFVKDHFYIIDGFTLLRTKEIADIDSLPPEMHDPIIPRTTKSPLIKHMCFKMAFDDMREVHKRRYLLQPIAVEVFSSDGRNFLLAFPRKTRNKVYDRLQAVGTALTDSAHQSISGQKQSAKVEPGTGLISSLMGEKSVTQRWERGEISNFEYLMCLNTLAGRSYNDLMQYPVFPWVIADYDTQELNLYSAPTFRDLSRPMGAQTPERLKQFEKRYNDWDDPTGETPPYHYGTHYSSAMIVASYLVRMEPFTQTFLRLQGGHFDLADRMFHSIKDAWLSAAKHNMADVKELIPEFYYLPEFLLNDNNFDLGMKQSGAPLGDVVLPPWAKGDAREFIRAHREALECDYVSAHLNEWIDLIFGYKQQCPAAVEAVNVFHYLFYEGNVDIYAIDDPLRRTATIGFINNFGQIPKQLFKKPHPQKKLSVRGHPSATQLGFFVSSAANDRLFFHNVDNLRPSMQPLKELKGAVGQIIQGDRHTVFTVEQNKALVPPSYSRYLAWGFPDMSVRIGYYDSDKASTVFESADTGDILCAVCPHAKLFVTAGTSSVVNVWEFGKGRHRRRLTLKKSLFGHSEAVTCLTASAAYNVIVSGSRDRTCIIWDLNELVFVRQLRGHAAPVAAVAINELTGDIATCAGTYLHLWSVNGCEIANINTAVGRNQQILCVAMSQMKEWDSSNVIMTGNSDGVVRMWSLEFVEAADDELITKKLSDKSDDTDTVSRDSADIVEKSVSQAVDIPSLCVSNRRTNLGVAEYSSSVDSDTGHMQYAIDNWLTAEKQRCDDTLPTSHVVDTIGSDGQHRSRDVAAADAAAAGELFIMDEEEPSTPSRGSTSAAPHLRYMAKSETLSSVPTVSIDTPESGDFCFVTEQDVNDSLMASGIQQRKLRDGFHWQKQLVFCSKLTMHTAFERKDNKEPAAVTALAVSRDHKSLYVGDAKGRVYLWSVADQPGRSVVDHWVKDEGGDSCVACHVKFSFAERRHHCRNCGQLFCARCSNYETEIHRLRIMKPVRVCQSCYSAVQLHNAAAAAAPSSSSSASSSRGVNPLV